VPHRAASSLVAAPETPGAPQGDVEEFTLACARAHLRLYTRTRPSSERVAPLEAAPLFRAQRAEGRSLLTDLARRRELGLYISGLPGVGKSTLLLHLILDDIQAGRPCCVLDPHGDLIRAILDRLPDDEATLRRVTLFDPADTDWPIGLNLLDAKTERACDLAVQFMLELYEEMFLPDQQGPMLHQSLRNGLRLLIELGGVLPELSLLFTNHKFLAHRLMLSKDPWVRHYFEKVWQQFTGSERGEYLAYFTSKLSCFVDDHVLRNIVGQPQGLDISAATEGGGVVLANLSRGAIGDRNSRLLGMLLLHKLERLAMERVAMAPEERQPVHVYVDEFHEFATEGFGRFLAAARKFNVGLVLAHQRLETLSASLREAVLGAVGHVILFRQVADQWFGSLPRLVWPRFGERELLSLPSYHAVVRVVGAEGTPRLGRLTVPQPSGGWMGAADPVRILTRNKLARPRGDVEREILERLGWTPPGEKGEST
jgi:hypothetical protein